MGFAIAEHDRGGPRLIHDEFPTRAFQIRFCDGCDDDIRAAHLKVHRARSLRAAGMAFGSSRWNRAVEITLPHSTRPDSEI